MIERGIMLHNRGTLILPFGSRNCYVVMILKNSHLLHRLFIVVLFVWFRKSGCYG